MTLKLSEFAQRLGARPHAPIADIELAALATPAFARACDVSFVLAGAGSVAQAAAVLSTVAAAGSANSLVVEDVLVALARSAAWLPLRRNAAAVFEQRATIAASASIAPSAQVADGVAIGEGAVIESGVVLGPGVSIGAYARIGAGTVIVNHAHIGNRARIGAGSSIGEDGFAFVRDGSSWLQVPSFGSVRIGDDVVILPQVVIHAGVFGNTQIAHGCILDSQVLIGHDSSIGANTAIAGQTAIAGAASIGRSCLIGGKVGISEGVVLADHVTVTAMSMVTRSIATAGSRYSSGWPAEPSTTWWRRVGRLRRAARGAATAPDGRLTES